MGTIDWPNYYRGEVEPMRKIVFQADAAFYVSNFQYIYSTCSNWWRYSNSFNIVIFLIFLQQNPNRWLEHPETYITLKSKYLAQKLCIDQNHMNVTPYTCLLIYPTTPVGLCCCFRNHVSPYETHFRKDNRQWPQICTFIHPGKVFQWILSFFHFVAFLKNTCPMLLLN